MDLQVSLLPKHLYMYFVIEVKEKKQPIKFYQPNEHADDVMLLILKQKQKS